MESCISVRRRSGKVYKDYMEGIMNEEYDWDHNVEGDAVEGPVDCVCRYIHISECSPTTRLQVERVNQEK